MQLIERYSIRICFSELTIIAVEAIEPRLIAQILSRINITKFKMDRILRITSHYYYHLSLCESLQTRAVNSGLIYRSCEW